MFDVKKNFEVAICCITTISPGLGLLVRCNAVETF